MKKNLRVISRGFEAVSINGYLKEVVIYKDTHTNKWNILHEGANDSYINLTKPQAKRVAAEIITKA